MLNVNSFPFPGSCEVGQTHWMPQPQKPFLRIGPFPKAIEEDSWCQFSPMWLQCSGKGMSQMSWQTFLEQRGNMLRYPQKLLRWDSKGPYKGVSPQTESHQEPRRLLSLRSQPRLAAFSYFVANCLFLQDLEMSQAGTAAPAPTSRDLPIIIIEGSLR